MTLKVAQLVCRNAVIQRTYKIGAVLTLGAIQQLTLNNDGTASDYTTHGTNNGFQNPLLHIQI